MKGKLVAERQRAMGAECHLVPSLVGVAQHVVWCLLGLVLHVPQHSRGSWPLLGL